MTWVFAGRRRAQRPRIFDVVLGEAIKAGATHPEYSRYRGLYHARGVWLADQLPDPKYSWSDTWSGPPTAIMTWAWYGQTPWRGKNAARQVRSLSTASASGPAIPAGGSVMAVHTRPQNSPVELDIPQPDHPHQPHGQRLHRHSYPAQQGHVWRQRFCHEAGIHQDGMLKHHTRMRSCGRKRGLSSSALVLANIPAARFRKRAEKWATGI